MKVTGEKIEVKPEPPPVEYVLRLDREAAVALKAIVGHVTSGKGKVSDAANELYTTIRDLLGGVGACQTESPYVSEPKFK